MKSLRQRGRRGRLLLAVGITGVVAGQAVAVGSADAKAQSHFVRPRAVHHVPAPHVTARPNVIHGHKVG